MFNSISMTRLAASVAKAMGAEAPRQAEAPIPFVDDLVKNALGGRADRVMIYNPDCIPMWLYQKYAEKFAPVLAAAPLTVPMATVMPSVTPVCSGARPAVHGIQSYTKPVITTDSLFDSLRRSGKRVALAAVADSSMALIFQNRDIDYFLMPYDGEATEKGLELIASRDYDVVVVYNQEYDDMIHDTVPESPQAMAAVDHHIQAFTRLTDAVREHWADSNSMVVWATDHGNHIDWDGHGNHGEYRPEDINVMHFYGAYPKR